MAYTPYYATWHDQTTATDTPITAAALNTIEAGITAATHVRATATATTSSLAANASDSSQNITLGQGFTALSIRTTRPARVRLYSTAAARTADLSRAIGTDPASSAGVILDYVTIAANTTYSLSPLVTGANLEASPTDAISMTVTNLDSTTGTVTVTVVWLRTE